jgi:hemolysin D
MGTELTTRETRQTWLTTRRRTDIVGEVVGAFESETAAVFLNTAPRREHITVYVLTALVTVTVVLSCIVNLDIVVTGIGTVSPVGGAIYLSPFDTAIVKEIKVKAGDLVKKGEPLAILDPTFTQADLVQLQEHKASDEPLVAREQAEVDDVQPRLSNGDQYQVLQAGIWRQRHQAYQSNIENFTGQIRSSAALVEQYKSDVRQYTQRVKLADEVEKVYEPLLQNGYVSKLQLMSATDSRTEMTRLLADAHNEVDVNTETMTALKAQLQAYIKQWHSDTAAQLVLDKNDLDATNQLLEKAQKARDLVTLDAPEDALVVQVGKASKNSVLSGAGQALLSSIPAPLFTLMPVNAPLFAEVWIQTADIGFVKVGHEVRLKLDAYLYLDYGVAKGVVKSISENSFSVDNNNTPVPPYFKVNVAITDVHLRYVPKTFRLLPGDTLTGDIMVGQRTIMTYMLDGLFKTTAEAMREP